MKLRNKNTGVIVKFLSLELVDEDEIEFTHVMPSGHENALSYHSLEKFKEEWEIYKPTEPLIKDEKIRKAVRAWADANEIETVDYDKYWVAFGRDDKTISFKDYDKCLGFYGLDDNATYTIDELCGEDEE